VTTEELESVLSGLPGAEWIGPGLSELSSGQETVGSLLVAIAATRLRRAGLPVESAVTDAELRLYHLLLQQEGSREDAYREYNALIDRLVRFTAALEQRLARRSSPLA